MAVCGGANYYGNRVSYSYGAPVGARMALGESSSSGGWAGAGTNGGVNLAILDISCGAHPGLEVYDMGGLFAGVQLVGTIWIRGGDTNIGPDRGSWFATNALADLNGSVSWDWATTVYQITSGSGCANAPGGISPGTGINGCGAMVMMSRESTLQRAYDKIKWATWLTIRDDANDAQGDGYYEYRRIANWNMTQAPAVLP